MGLVWGHPVLRAVLVFLAITRVGEGLTATLFGPRLEAAARRTVAARAAFATALVSSLSAARTVKLAGATRPVLHTSGSCHPSIRVVVSRRRAVARS